MQRAVHLKLLRWLDKQQTTYWQSSTSCLTFRCVLSLAQILASASVLFKDYSSWVYQRNCPPWRLNSVLYGLTLTLTIPRKFPLKAWRCVSNSLLVPRQVSRNSSSVIRKFLVNYRTSKDSYLFFFLGPTAPKQKTWRQPVVGLLVN